MNSIRGDKHIRENVCGGNVSSFAGSTDDRWAGPGWPQPDPKQFHGQKVRLELYGLDPETLENILSISVIDVQDEYNKAKIAEKMSEYDKQNPIPRLDFDSTDPHWHSPEGRRKRGEIRPLRDRRNQFETELLDDLLDGKNSPLYGEIERDDNGRIMRIRGNFGHIPLALPVTPLPTEHEQLVSSEISNLPVPPEFIRPPIPLNRPHGRGSGTVPDDLTVQLQVILRINKRCHDNIDAGAPQIIIDDLQELLTYHVSAYLDN
ncbi:uncharacterized protein METZ01_LOCUS397177, partial [marine metagenome]